MFHDIGHEIQKANKSIIFHSIVPSFKVFSSQDGVCYFLCQAININYTVLRIFNTFCKRETLFKMKNINMTYIYMHLIFNNRLQINILQFILILNYNFTVLLGTLFKSVCSNLPQ